MATQPTPPLAAAEPSGAAHEESHERPESKLLSSSSPFASSSSLLLSHLATKLGSKAWEFATPLILLYLSYPSLAAPAFYGLSIFTFKFFIGPYAGGTRIH